MQNLICDNVMFRTASGCPRVTVNLSFPELEFCDGPSFIAPIPPKIPKPPLLLPIQDIPGTDFKCIDIKPITDVSVGGGDSLDGDFNVDDASGDCGQGKYRLNYRLNVGCALSTLPSVVPILRNGVSVGALMFAVASGCKLHINPIMTCFTCTPTLGEGCRSLNIDMPVDIPIYYTDRPDDAENNFGELNYWQDGCAFGGSIKLYYTCVSIRENLNISFDTGDPKAVFTPNVNGCRLESYSLEIDIPDPEKVFKLVEADGNNNIHIDVAGNKFVVRSPFSDTKTGPTGPTGPTGTRPADIFSRGSVGDRGTRGSMGSVGTGYVLDIDDKYRGKKGKTGPVLEISENCVDNYYIHYNYQNRYLNINALASLKIVYNYSDNQAHLQRYKKQIRIGVNYIRQFNPGNTNQDIPVTIL